MRRETLTSDAIFVLHDFLTPEECAAFIRVSEQSGYDDAPITTAAGFLMRKDIRNNDRLMVDDPELAQKLFERAKPGLVEKWFQWHLLGFNERWRYYRYKPGQRFAPHTDGSYFRPNGDVSQFTFMIYLNDDFEGGQTAFELPLAKSRLMVQPERGKALVFYHRQVHEGCPVESGCKYVLRTDIMYTTTTEKAPPRS